MRISQQVVSAHLAVIDKLAIAVTDHFCRQILSIDKNMDHIAFFNIAIDGSADRRGAIFRLCSIDHIVVVRSHRVDGDVCFGFEVDFHFCRHLDWMFITRSVSPHNMCRHMCRGDPV